MLNYPFPPFKTKVVEAIPITTQDDRRIWLEEAGYNVFNIPADRVTIDLLTDSGTSAMSDQQWAGLNLGDESYAMCRNYFELKNEVENLTGLPIIIPTHQGRAAEHIFFSALDIKAGDVVVSNQFFDTTRANVEDVGAKALDLVIDEAHDPRKIISFKGNLDTNKLKSTIEKYGKAIKLLVLTITNNSGGGQPVSMANIREVGKITKENGILFMFDAARFAENVYFIKARETEFKGRTTLEITKEMFSCVDGFLMSAKKDGLVNIGGMIALRDEKLAEKVKQRMVVLEGFPTYGGLAGRDLEAVARGLREVLDPRYLLHRIEQVAYLGQRLKDARIVVVEPFGGHGIYLDGGAFLQHLPRNQFPGWALTVALYERYGIRAVELGSVAFGRKDPETGEQIFVPIEYVRLAIPRRVYSRAHIDYVADSMIDLYENRDQVRGVYFTYEPAILRHFTARFALK